MPCLKLKYMIDCYIYICSSLALMRMRGLRFRQNLIIFQIISFNFETQYNVACANYIHTLCIASDLINNFVAFHFVLLNMLDEN
jgi:hypothetical protein